jgi:hypothetical protein
MTSHLVRLRARTGPEFVAGSPWLTRSADPWNG